MYWLVNKTLPVFTYRFLIFVCIFVLAHKQCASTLLDFAGFVSSVQADLSFSMGCIISCLLISCWISVAAAPLSSLIVLSSTGTNDRMDLATVFVLNCTCMSQTKWSMMTSFGSWFPKCCTAVCFVLHVFQSVTLCCSAGTGQPCSRSFYGSFTCDAKWTCDSSHYLLVPTTRAAGRMPGFLCCSLRGTAKDLLLMRWCYRLGSNSKLLHVVISLVDM